MPTMETPAAETQTECLDTTAETRGERPTATPEVRWERLLPAEFRTRMASLPVVFLPLGTVEWHGEHNALGLDSLKAHALLVRTALAAGGGVVHPPVYGGMGGLDKPATVIMEPELTWDNHLLRPWLEQLCSEFQRNGAKAVVMLTGHYGHNQQIVVRETAVRMTKRLRIPILGTPEYWLAHDTGYLGDHAGVGETSLLLHLEPEMVDMTREDGEFGAAESTGTIGERYTSVIVRRLAGLAREMPSWDDTTIDTFVAAEAALVDVQTRLWRTSDPWAAWRHLIERRETGYGALLEARDFNAIQALAGRLA